MVQHGGRSLHSTGRPGLLRGRQASDLLLASPSYSTSSAVENGCKHDYWCCSNKTLFGTIVCCTVLGWVFEQDKKRQTLLMLWLASRWHVFIALARQASIPPIKHGLQAFFCSDLLFLLSHLADRHGSTGMSCFLLGMAGFWKTLSSPSLVAKS